MPNNYRLTNCEKTLSFFAVISVLLAITVSLCIGLVLPYSWTYEGYVDSSSGQSDHEKFGICGCGRRQYATNYINCVPKALSNRINSYSENKSESDCAYIQNYPYLVSLSIPAYKDEKMFKRFACSGTILSKHWIIVGDGCTKNHDEMQELTIRAGSSYWAKGGTLHKFNIMSRFTNEGPSAVKVEPPFMFNENIRPVKLPKKGVHDTTWKSAVSVGWNSAHIRKHDRFTVKRWSTTYCKSRICRSGQIRGDFACGHPKFGQSLVTDLNVLIGIHSGICGQPDTAHMYLDMQSEDFIIWFEFLMGTGDGHNNTIKPKSSTEEIVSSPVDIFEVRGCTASDFPKKTTLNNEVTDIDEYDGDDKSTESDSTDSTQTKTTSFEETDEIKHTDETESSTETEATYETGGSTSIDSTLVSSPDDHKSTETTGETNSKETYETEETYESEETSVYELTDTVSTQDTAMTHMRGKFDLENKQDNKISKLDSTTDARLDPTLYENEYYENDNDGAFNQK